MKIGDYVTPNEGVYLRTGCGCYAGAVVVSLEPFVLVSEDAEMRWQTTVKREDFTSTGQQVLGYVFEKCFKRL